jgi:glycosyltransferase involved in cell wall biosynthesis
MRIGIDACCWSNKRGVGRFTRELLSALIAVDQKNEYVFFVDKDTAFQCKFPDGINMVVARTHVPPTEAASSSGRRSLRDVWALSRQVMNRNLDIFFFPAAYTYFPIFNRSKKIVTVHDMIANHHPEKAFPNKKLMFFWKLKQYLAIHQSHVILTVSEYSKKQIMAYYNLPESQIRVIPEGPSSVFKVLPCNEEMLNVLSRYRLGSGERFLLYVGGISPHKNLRALVEAYNQLIKDSMFSDIKLVLLGDYEKDAFYSDYQSLKSYIGTLHLVDKIIFTGFIEDVELSYFYNAAALLVFPSIEEGFGLPAVEAMASGTPVAASNRGSLPEIVGEAGCFFNPHNPDEILNVVKRVLANNEVREEMSRSGLKRAEQFSWDKAAKELMSIFNEFKKS